MRTIVAGSRSIKDYKIVCDAIKESGFEITEVFSGTANGIDKLGEKWAKDNGIKVKRFPAKWSDISNPNAVIKENQYGKYNAVAGFERNEQMAIHAQAAIIIIECDSSEEKNIIEMAEKYQLKTYIKKI